MPLLWSKFFGLGRLTTPPQSELCRAFRQLSIQTETWLSLSQPYCLDPSETTITDFNLFELAVGYPDRVAVYRYPGSKEKESGADWFWSILTDGGWQSMFVQAKRLYPSRRYEALRHPVEFKQPVATPGASPAVVVRQQVDVLVEKAAKEGHPALYCFYNGAAPASGWPNAGCHPAPESFGCTIAGAQFVQSLLRDAATPREVPLEDVAPVAFPWANLVCCDRSQPPLPSLGKMQAAITACGEDPGAADANLPSIVARAATPDGLAGLHEEMGIDGVLAIDMAGESNFGGQ